MSGSACDQIAPDEDFHDCRHCGQMWGPGDTPPECSVAHYIGCPLPDQPCTCDAWEEAG